jgi:hypothetical protein
LLCKNNSSQIRTELFNKKNKTVYRKDINRIAWRTYRIKIEKGINQGNVEERIFQVDKSEREKRNEKLRDE